jgi:hypothetical protein
MEWCAEITVFAKHGGPLTKTIALQDGRLVNDSSSCRMANGEARRVTIASMEALADLINGFSEREAYALGRLRDGLADHVRVVRAEKLNGADDPNAIARTLDYLKFSDGPGLALLDLDLKGISPAAKQRMQDCGDYWGALCDVLPAFEVVAAVERASTSSGLRNTETGEAFPDSGGRHLAIAVANAADIPRFLSDLHARCWLAGFGWGMVSAAGSFLERSIVDKSCGSPERLIFEGKPIIEPPLEQIGRQAVAHEGSTLDTEQLCPPLTNDEQIKYHQLLAAEQLRLLPERQATRAAWSVQHIQAMVARGIPERVARARVDDWIDGKELSGSFPLPFDALELAGATVADVLAAPDKYVGKTLADPFEGPSYGRGKAILYKRNDSSLLINSFAHGGVTYLLKSIIDDPRQRPIAASTKVLETMKFDPIKHVVPGIFIEGLTLFAGKPKIGKSWLLLDAAIAVATNGWTLGELHCMQGDVLYCALEDSERRLKSRLSKLSRGFPERLFYFTELPRLSVGGLDQIRAWITAHPQARLVIIDTLAMVKEGRKREEGTYDADYRAVLDLRKLANELRIAIVIVHHLRKAEADDPFDTISGTLGLTGAPDSVLVLRQNGPGNYSLHGKGRDLVEVEKAMTYDKETCRWRIAGEAIEVKRSSERAAVLAAISEASEPIGPNDIAAETGMKAGNVRRLLAKLVKEGAIEKEGYGRYKMRAGDMAA